ncbi:MAG: hypothetical protein AAF481_11675 [Acidobacteriota bacterium]
MRVRETFRRTRLLGLSLCLALGVAFAGPALAWDVDTGMSQETFRLFHDRMVFAAYPYARHGAAPLGLVGFDIYADLSADLDAGDDDAFLAAIDGSLPGDALAFVRVGARKGLPGGFDLGAGYARAVDGDIELLSADLQWAILKGGALKPALSLRLTGTQNLDSGPYQVEIYGAEVLLSKGFPLFTPYVGVGFYRGEGDLERSGGGRFSRSEDGTFAYAGVTVNLLVPKINFELEQGESFQGAVRVSIGL